MCFLSDEVRKKEHVIKACSFFIYLMILAKVLRDTLQSNT